MSHKAISNVVKRCGKIHSVNDVIACGVLKDSADLVLQLVQTIVGQTSITIHRPDTRASQCALVDVSNRV